MKIIAACDCRLQLHNIPPSLSFSKEQEQTFPPFRLLPDTALTRCGRPFFVPEFAEPCSWQCCLVARISRLGRTIPERFARRYYDGITLGVLFTAEALLRQCRAEALPWELATAFDGAAHAGRFLLAGESGETAPSQLVAPEALSVEVWDGEEKLQVLPAERSVEALIAAASRLISVRQGDYLYAEPITPPRPARIGTIVSGCLGGEKVLSFRIK